jgi:hypothetical protein
MEFHMARPSLPLIVLLLALTGPEGDPQIDPQHVTTLEAMDGEEMAVTIFLYDRVDSRGWPASPEDRQFVRFLQDNGIDVAFQFHEQSGLHYALVFGSDFNRFLALKQIAQEKGIPVPEMVPPAAIAAAEGLANRTGPELPWWLNAIFLFGTLAVLFWVFALRDRPT